MLILAHPSMLAIAAAIAAVACIAAMVRRPAMPLSSQLLVAAGMAALALAAGGLTLARPAVGQITVMVDLSGSTRTATYRRPELLARRIAQLLGSAPRRVLYFADGHTDQRPPGDLPSTRTVFAPPPAEAILLFSDAQFDLPPAAPQTYIVVDPALEQPADAAILAMETRDGAVAVTVANGGETRTLTVAGAAQAIDRGRITATVPLKQPAGMVVAQLAGHDPWPENDAMSLAVPPARVAERWWTGSRPPPSGFASAQLPEDEAEYLSAGVIVLDNVPAGGLTDLQLTRLQQFVRDLGGGLVILGGDRAFAAGEYPGTLLDSLSPLSSLPPEPNRHWIILLDSSGSMDQRVGAATRWEQARTVAIDVLRHLPPEDPVTLGNFAERLTWWAAAATARQTLRLPLPVVQPRGPTNLQPALQQVLAQVRGDMPTQMLLLTDAEAQLSDVPALAGQFRQRKITLSVLLLKDGGEAAEGLRQIVAATGGTFATQADPQQWSGSARQLARAALKDHLVRQPVEVTMRDGLPRQSASIWNRTWPKQGAQVLGEARHGGQFVPMAARWAVGEGNVAAAAFAAEATLAAALADLVAQAPRDPRLRATIEQGRQVIAKVDAVDGRRYLNGLSLTLDLVGGASLPLQQDGPGSYCVEFPAPPRPALARLRHDGRIIAQAALAGRYPQEFDAIGNNRPNMRQLAERTGGRVVEPSDARPISFHWPQRQIALARWLALVAAALVAAGLVRWRLSPVL
mgnify:CR=1 FL=1